jgi:hypothetical protein
MYEQLSDEQLAQRVSEILGFKYDSALRVIRSDDVDLGRNWAISFLKSEAQFEENYARLTQHAEALRRLSV